LLFKTKFEEVVYDGWKPSKIKGFLSYGNKSMFPSK